jgi:hypothetical protein
VPIPASTGRKAWTGRFRTRAGPGAHPGLDGRFGIASFDGAPDMVYLDNALAGQVVEGPAELARAASGTTY